MNANELADWIEDENVVDIMLTSQEHYRGLVAAMLRQQQAEIEALKTDNLKYKEWSEYTEKKADEFYDELEELKAKLARADKVYDFDNPLLDEEQ